jgi:hypothetical protein
VTGAVGPLHLCVHGRGYPFHAARLAGTGDPFHVRIVGTDVCELGLNASAFGQRTHLSLLIGARQGDDGPRLPGASGAPSAMQVVLGVCRCIDVHNQADVIDMDSARSDIRRDEHRCGTGFERLEGTVARPLGLAAMEGADCDASPGELLCESIRSALGAHEHDGASLARCDS